MSLKAQIKDYQIIKSAALDFIPGLNVIVGPSNNGKTSILKALKAAIYTVPGATPIRAGQSSYTVGIGYNGHTVILQKGMKESIYVVDGEKYTKFGTTTPEAVSKALNIRELVLNGNKEQLNFWDQMDYPFLLDKSSVELFRFIIDSGDEDQVSKALKLMVSDRQQMSKDIDQIQGSINTLDLKIDEYTNQLEKAKPVIEACNNILLLQSRVARLNLLKELKQQHSNLELQKVEIANRYDKAFNIFKVYREFLQQYNARILMLNNLKDMFSNLHNLVGEQSDIADQLVKIKVIKDLAPIETLKLTQLKEIKEMINNIKVKKENIQVKPSVSWNYSKDDFDKLLTLKSYVKNHADIDYKQVELATSMIAQKESIKLYEELKTNFDICPLCGNKLNNH